MWHQAYDDPSSSLARRLEVVRARLGAILDERRATHLRLLSLCAGDGRDVIPVLAEREGSIIALLVEQDEVLARRAVESAAAAGAQSVDVRCADAADPASFVDALPVDVLLLCGIFGNVEHARVKDVVDVAPALLADAGYVIWTRGGSDPDRRPEIRAWFEAAGLREVAFDGAPESFGVGVNQLVVPSQLRRTPLPRRLFAFV